MLRFKKGALAALLTTSAIVLSGCGGGGGGSSNETTASTTTSISGSAVAGAVSGRVKVTDADGNRIASGNVSDGSFTVNVPDGRLAAELRFLVTGSYVDEVSGHTVTLDDDNPLSLITPAAHFSSGSKGNAPVSPDSTIIYHLVKDQAKSLTEAKAAFKSVFGYEPDMSAVAFDPSTTDSASAAARPQADKDAAFRAGALSQLAADLQLSKEDIPTLLKALADDLGDGNFDGVGATGADVTVGTAAVNLKNLNSSNPMPTRLLKAWGTFSASAKNVAKVAAPSQGRPAMNYDASGTTKQVTSQSGRVLNVKLETVAATPFKPGFLTSRVTHKVTITDSADGSPININTDADFTAISQKPFMHMLTGMNHSTPYNTTVDSTDAASGVYLFDAYYVMASAMKMGDKLSPMGVWDYTVTIGDESVLFHPQVKMPMDGSVYFSAVSNSEHKWTKMTGETLPRPYRIWLHDVKANNGNHDVTVFVSTVNLGNMMMSFPAVDAGTQLHGPAATGGMRMAFNLASATVDMSTDDGENWTPMNADGNGLYTVSSSAINAGSQNTTLFKLTINDGSERVMTTKAGGNAKLVYTAP